MYISKRQFFQLITGCKRSGRGGKVVYEQAKKISLNNYREELAGQFSSRSCRNSFKDKGSVIGKRSSFRGKGIVSKQLFWLISLKPLCVREPLQSKSGVALKNP